MPVPMWTPHTQIASEELSRACFLVFLNKAASIQHDALRTLSIKSHGGPDLHLTFASRVRRSERNAHKSSNPVAICIVNSGCIGGMDNHPRGSVSRASRILPATLQGFTARSAKEVLLSVHLRILLQPLRRDLLLIPHAVQAAVHRLERIPLGDVCTSVGRKYLHEYLQPAEAGYSKREGRAESQRNRCG